MLLTLLALSDVVVTLLIPFLVGAAITYPGRGGVIAFLRLPPPAGQLLDAPGTFRPLRLIVLVLPLLWQVLMGTYLLAERLFGVLVIVGVGMLAGSMSRGVVRRIRAARSDS